MCRLRVSRSSKLTRLLPRQIHDTGYVIRLTVTRFKCALSLQNIGNFLHARGVVIAERGGKDLRANGLADDGFTRQLAARQNFQGGFGNKIRSDQLGGRIGLLLQQIDSLFLDIQRFPDIVFALDQRVAPR